MKLKQAALVAGSILSLGVLFVASPDSASAKAKWHSGTPSALRGHWWIDSYPGFVGGGYNITKKTVTTLKPNGTMNICKKPKWRSLGHNAYRITGRFTKSATSKKTTRKTFDLGRQGPYMLLNGFSDFRFNKL